MDGPSGFRTRRRPLDRVGIADVDALDVDPARVARRQRGPRSRQVFASDVPQLHGRPALEKRGRRGQADPPPAAGDDDAAALDGKQRVGHGAY